MGSSITFLGLKLEVVPVGTEIKDKRTGQAETLGEGGAIKAGNVMYCTQAVYDKLVEMAKRKEKEIG